MGRLATVSKADALAVQKEREAALARSRREAVQRESEVTG
jgi:hypothetical protein